MTGPIRVLIVDDEPLARKSIRSLLEGDPHVVVAGECSSGEEAYGALLGGGVDLLFLDIQMPGISGFDLLQKLGPESLPAVIFVTAYDEYAVRAFEVQSVDYLLKPFDDERFRKALARAKTEIRSRDVAAAQRQIAGLLEELHRRAPAARSAEPYPERLMVRSTGRVHLVGVDEIDWIEADGDYARLSTSGKVHLLRETLSELERRLDPACFIRIHRSYIVRVDRIRELRAQSNGDYRVVLRDGREFPMSRTFREQVFQRLGPFPA